MQIADSWTNARMSSDNQDETVAATKMRLPEAAVI